MAAIGGGSEKANITGKDLAAALAPDRGRAPVLNKDVLALRDRFRKDAGQSVFQAEIAANEEDLMVNFDEMRRVVDSERKAVDAETDPKRKDVLKKRADRLDIRYGVYDKLLNNGGVDAMTDAEKHEVVGTVARLPGFAEAASVVTGGRLSADQMMQVLEGKGGIAMTRDEKKVLNEMISNIANDDRFKNRLSKNLSALKLSDDDAKITKDIDDLKYKLREKDDVQRKLDEEKKVKDDYEKTYATKDKREQVKDLYQEVNDKVANLDSQYRPKTFGDAELAGIKSRLNTLRTTAIAAATAGAAGPQALELAARAQRATDEYDTIEQIESIAKGQGGVFKDYEKYTGALADIEENEKKMREFSQTEKEIVNKESERSKYSDKYKRKMEVALSEEMKRYWNEVILENAGKSAEAQAAIKGEEKSAQQKEKDTRVAKTKEILDRFMQLSYLKYENGEVKGWDDEAIKQFAKKDIFSRSPKQISRDILDRIIRQRGRMPRAYGKEIDAMFKEMGVGTGTPPLTSRDILNSIDASQYEKWAEEKIPDLMGYAWARGYYFDRMKITPAQAEFLQRSYTGDFFANALAAKGQYSEEAAKLLGADFMGGGAVTKEKIKEMLGKDWVGGSKKLMKALAIAGAGYALAGGLVWQGGTYVGLQHVIDNVKSVFGAGAATAQAISRGGDWAINAPTSALAHALNGQLPAVDTNPLSPNYGKLATDAAGNYVQPGIKPFIPVRGAPYPDSLYPKK